MPNKGVLEGDLVVYKIAHERMYASRIESNKADRHGLLTRFSVPRKKFAPNVLSVSKSSAWCSKSAGDKNFKLSC